MPWHLQNGQMVPNIAALSPAAGPPAPTPSYWHSLSRGDRTASITVTTTATLGGGTINNLVDGGLATNTTDSAFFNNGQSTREIKFDFGTAYIVNGLRWLQDILSNHGTWIFEGSNDDSSYTQIGSSFALGGVVLTIFEGTNSTAYRYYKLRQTAGTTSNSSWLLEIQFRIAGTGDVARDALEQGDRTASITATTTASLSQGAINNIIDGAYVANSTDAFAFGAESTREIKFDLGSGVAKKITGFDWLQNLTTSHGTWVIEGSNDDSSYTGLGSSFTLGGVLVREVTYTNTTAYRYYKLRQTSGTTSSTPWNREIEFRIEA